MFRGLFFLQLFEFFRFCALPLLKVAFHIAERHATLVETVGGGGKQKTFDLFEQPGAGHMEFFAPGYQPGVECICAINGLLTSTRRRQKL